MKKIFLVGYLVFSFARCFSQVNDSASSCQVSVSPDNMNMLFIGIDNPITISSEYPSDKLLVTMKGGTLSKQSSNGYIATFTQRGDASISVSYKSDSGLVLLFSRKYKVRLLSRPGAQLGTIANGATERIDIIKKNSTTIYSSRGEGYPIEGLTYEVESFSFSLVKNKGGKMVTIAGTSNKLSADMIKLIETIEAGDKIIIDNIKLNTDIKFNEAMPIVITAK